MGDRTIPAPHEDEFRVAFIGLRVQASARGLDLSDPAIADFVQHTAEVMAQRDAEIRFLRGILHRGKVE